MRMGPLCTWPDGPMLHISCSLSGRQVQGALRHHFTHATERVDRIFACSGQGDVSARNRTAVQSVRFESKRKQNLVQVRDPHNTTVQSRILILELL